jgi:hypothetical protein
MSIEQVAFAVPADVAAGIASGELIRYGGIVRQANGAIYMHLKEVVEVPRSSGGAVSKILWSTKGRVYFGTLLLLGGLSGVAYSVRRRKVGECVGRLSLAMQAYVKAVQEQNMNVSVISGLLESLEAVEDLKSRRVYTVMEGVEFQEFIQFVAGYSREFIARNQVESMACENGREAEVVDLRQYLECQRNLFDCAV